MPAFECIVTRFDFEQLRTGLDSLAIESAAESEYGVADQPAVPKTTAAMKQDREQKLEAAAVRLHDIYVQRGKIPEDAASDKFLACRAEPDNLDSIQGYVEAAAYQSLKQNKGIIGEGTVLEPSAMAKEDAKHTFVRAAKSYYNLCFAQACQAARELNAAVAESSRHGDTESEATTLIESSGEEESEEDEDSFKNKVNAVYQLPAARKKEERKDFWNQLKINDFVLLKDSAVGKQGVYSLRVDPLCPNMTITFDKSKIRPTISLVLDDPDSIKLLSWISDDEDFNDYLTSPAVPAILKLIYVDQSPAFPEFTHVKVEAEIGPAHLQEIARCFLVMRKAGIRTGKGDKKWWLKTGKEAAQDVAADTHWQYRDEVARIVKLQTKNTAYERITIEAAE